MGQPIANHSQVDTGQLQHRRHINVASVQARLMSGGLDAPLVPTVDAQVGVNVGLEQQALVLQQAGRDRALQPLAHSLHIGRVLQAAA